VLPRQLDAPWWARYGNVSWQEAGYRLLVPLHGATGAMEALYARSLRPLVWTGTVRSMPPVAGRTGLVMANATARAGLSEGRWPKNYDWRTIVIAGGAADYLEWASSLLTDGPAVFGIVPGSWSREIAERIPLGTRVIVRAHANPITSRYAHRVQAALDGRCEVIVRTAA